MYTCVSVIPKWLLYLHLCQVVSSSGLASSTSTLPQNLQPVQVIVSAKVQLQYFLLCDLFCFGDRHLLPMVYVCALIFHFSFHSSIFGIISYSV